MRYITNDGKLLQGSTYREILEAYQATSIFNADMPFEKYLYVMWLRIKEWQPSGKKEPEGEISMVIDVFSGLVLNGFLTEVV